MSAFSFLYLLKQISKNMKVLMHKTVFDGQIYHKVGMEYQVKQELAKWYEHKGYGKIIEAVETKEEKQEIETKEEKIVVETKAKRGRKK